MTHPQPPAYAQPKVAPRPRLPKPAYRDLFLAPDLPLDPHEDPDTASGTAPRE
jgi:hypothetical protein